MCCIFGIGFLKDHKFTNSDAAIGFTSILFKEAEIGGRAASGISIMSEKNVHVLRRNLSSSELIKTDEYEKFMVNNLKLGKDEIEYDKVQSIIGHCRLPTKGASANHYNNHPLVVNNIIGVHNGIISNDDALFKKYKGSMKRIAQVDTEIIFQLISLFTGTTRKPTATSTAIKMAASQLRGGYACAMQNANQPYNLYLFRVGNPIRAYLFTKLGIVVFATREYFIDRACKILEDEDTDTEELEIQSETGMSFNLYTKEYGSFALPMSRGK